MSELMECLRELWGGINTFGSRNFLLYVCFVYTQNKEDEVENTNQRSLYGHNEP